MKEGRRMLFKADKNKLRQSVICAFANIARTFKRPRLIFFPSQTHIYVRIIDDITGVTLDAACTYDKENLGSRANIERAKKVGAAIAKKALDKGITEVVFDCGGYILNEELIRFTLAAREAGLKF